MRDRLVSIKELKERYPDFKPFNPYVSKGLEIKYTNKYGRDRKTGKLQKALFAKKDFKKGELILEFKPSFKKKPDRHTVRIDADLNQTNPYRRAAENYPNHSCSPTGELDFSSINELRLKLVAARNIKTGEEITFNYFTTDESKRGGWKGDDEFKCRCGSKRHLNHGIIVGFDALPLSTKMRLKPHLSPYLRRKLEMYISRKQKTNNLTKD